MSALSEIDVRSIAGAATDNQAATIPPEVVTIVKAEINTLFWRWYESHKENTVAHVHFWIFTKEIKVVDLQQVLTLLFGAEGEDQSVERPPATVAPETQ